MDNEMVATQKNPMAMTQQKTGNALNIFSDQNAFARVMQMADMFSRATVVPKEYQGNPGNCMIAIEMAARISMSPMMVMQNLYIVNGRPSWSSQWIIAMINNSGRFISELQFDFGKDAADDGLSCIAWAVDNSGHRVDGPKITMKMAREEGWLSKNGSKWKTMPEVMIRYRAASFFGRLNCPDLVMGLYTKDEVIEMSDNDYSEVSAADTSVTEDEKKVTQEQVKALWAVATNFYGKADAKDVVLNIMRYRKLPADTHALTTAQYKDVMSDLCQMIEDAKKAESQLAENEDESIDVDYDDDFDDPLAGPVNE